MRLISSSRTWWHKNVTPVAYTYIFGTIFVVVLFNVLFLQAPAVLLPLVLCLAAYAYLLMRWLVFPLVDEAFIDGDSIVIKNRGEETHFPISDIMKVKSTRIINPERVVITLRVPCELGSKIAFLPQFRFFHFLSQHPIAIELKHRLHRISDTMPS